MTEQPRPERTSAMTAAPKRLRTLLATVSLSIRSILGRLRGTQRSEVAEQPALESAPAETEGERAGPEQTGRFGPAQRLLIRHWRLILVAILALAQGLLAYLGWRLRQRRRRQ